MGINLFLDDLATVSNDDRFAAIEEFARTQPDEGWRHDYAVDWGNSGLEKVAAFANTFGGLLVVGVKKAKEDSACEFVGVESPVEYKTSIVSSIAANISPVPAYSVYECHAPGAPSRKFCIIRIQESKRLHLITKKGLRPAYIRNEDQAIPAEAMDLRRLIEREIARPSLAGVQVKRAMGLQDALFINEGYMDKTAWPASPCRPSSTYLKMEVIPNELLAYQLERSHEDRLGALVSQEFRRIGHTPTGRETQFTDSRGLDYYELVSYHSEFDFESRWRITGAGDIGLGTQVKRPDKDVWSIVDLADCIASFVKLVSAWWEFTGYFGEGRFFCQLSVPGVPPRSHPQHHYYIHDFGFGDSLTAEIHVIPRDAIRLSASPRMKASAEAEFSYLSGSEALPRLATLVLNQLLRSLGHAVDWKLLQECLTRW
jgi:hypothetical protein